MTVEGQRTSASLISASAVRVTPDVNEPPAFETDTVDRAVEENESARAGTWASR